MKPSTYKPNVLGSDETAHQSATSTATDDPQTITLGGDTSAIYLTVETTNARATFDGTDPSVADAPSLLLLKDQSMLFMPIGAGATITFISTAAADSVLQVFELV